MKFLFALILSIFSLSVSAKKPLRLHIAAGKKNCLSLSCSGKFRKNMSAVITVTDLNGKLVSTQTVEMRNGLSDVNLEDAVNLPEGTYNVQMKTKNKTITSQFIVWK